MILIHMPSKLSTTLRMKEELTYLMVTMTYNLPYIELLGCDEIVWFVAVKGNLRGATVMLSMDMLIIIMVDVIPKVVHDC